MKMTADDVRAQARWHPASGHKSGKWRVYRHIQDGQGAEEYGPAYGQPRLYKARLTAQWVADALNARGDPEARVRLSNALAQLNSPDKRH